MNAVIQQLLTKYKFISTRACLDSRHRNVYSIAWQEKDAHLRQLAVECTGYAENGGTVYVCGEILSLLSEALKLKIERNQRIKFDCDSETFDIVMTFVHSTNCHRPTRRFPLQLLPMLRECEIPFISTLCVDSVVRNPVGLPFIVIPAFRAESELLLEYVLSFLQCRASLEDMVEFYHFFRYCRKTAFAGEALGRMMELRSTLPEYEDDSVSEDEDESVPTNERERAFFDKLRHERDNVYREHTLDFTVPSQLLDFPLIVGEEKLYVSRPVLALASPFFRRLFYGDGAEREMASFTVEHATIEEMKCLLTLVFPTAWGVVWRLTPIYSDSYARPLHPARFATLYRAAFGSDPVKFVNVFMLAEYFKITGLVDYLTDAAVEWLPWRQRLQMADLCKSGELMASVLTEDSLRELKEEMAVSAQAVDELSSPTSSLIAEYLLLGINV